MTLSNRILQADRIANAALFPWIVRAKAIAHQENCELPYAARMVGAPESIIEKLSKSASSRDNSPALSGASASVAEFIEATSQKSAFSYLIANRIVARAPLQSRLIVNAVDATGWITGEGDAIPVDELDLVGETLETFKAATIVVLTSDIWRDASSDGQAFLTRLLRTAVVAAADKELFARLIDTSTIGLTAQVAGVRDGLRQLIESVNLSSSSKLAFAASPAAMSALSTEDLGQNSDVFGGRLLGLPIVPTNGLSGRSVALMNGHQIALQLDRIDFDASEQATLELSTSPSSDATTPSDTNLTSLFQTNSIGVRTIIRGGMKRLRPSAIATLTITENA